MSSLIQRLFDRGTADAPSMPPVYSATPSVSPMAEFDQRLKGGHFPDLPGLPGDESSGDVTEFLTPETRHRPASRRAPPQVGTPPPQSAHRLPSKKPQIEPGSEGRQRRMAPPASKTQVPEARPAEPEDPRRPDTTPVAPFEPQRPPERRSKFQAAERKTSTNSPAAPERPPADTSQKAMQVAPPQPEAPKFNPIVLPLEYDDGLRHPERPDPIPKAPKPQVAEPPAQPAATATAELNGNAEARPAPVTSATAPPRPDPIPPPPALDNAPTAPERVVERIVREVPIEETDSRPAHREPATAEDVSKIGPLPQRQRAFTLFGRRIR